ncbi:hypothetical protein B0H21DRAFT_740607 [Amylocystis lapponica]|nr:hypothetical protein B0H21DRAFT_740607 [Amylocystis lapponica]
MSSKRDSLFLSGSLSRSVSVSRTGSHESLSAHPLLSPTFPAPPSSSSSSVDSQTSTTTPVNNGTPPRYVPYTPRQRVAPTSATTGATMHPNISAPLQQHQFQGDATSKLQIVNLKAAAQRIGLDTSSTGWAILERLSAESDHGPEWNEIWNALSTGKATLLLPLEPHPLNESITTEFLKDHIALCDHSPRNDAPIITLSGLRGILTNDTLTFRSTLSPSSKAFQAVLAPSQRASALAALPPLPPLPSVASPTTSSPTTPTSPTSKKHHSPRYPAYTVSTHTPALPLPPRPTATKPPLPPRPTIRTAVPAAGAAHHTPQSRLSNSFASLFGRATPPASPVVAPSPLQPDTPATPATPPAAPPDTPDHALDVPAYTLSARIDRGALGTALARALTAEVHAALALAGAGWAAERVDRFAAPFLPLVRRGARTWAVNGVEEGVEEVAGRFQVFYAEMEEAVRRRVGRERRGRRVRLRRGGREEGGSGESGSGGDGEEEESEKEREGEEEEEKREGRVREVMDVVERVVCLLFYDRLFLPESADDASHDEALSSRIAAVNLLDLGLTHLGVDIGKAGTEVEAVVRACGQTLVQLDKACYAPSDKAAILVAAHKIIVDGLSRLPPIGLRPEDEMLEEKTPHEAEDAKHTTNQQPESAEDSAVSHDQSASAAATSPTIVLSPEDAPSNTTLLHHQKDASPPLLTVSRPSTPTPVSGDVILPLMIFAVVKANPPRFVSNLLYTQRFRRETGGGGEEGYCLINLMAVAEFLENVDLAALGLGDSEKMVISASMLSPIPLTRSTQFIPGSEPPSPHLTNAGLRGRVEQQVDAIAGSANKVISGVVDTSFGVLRMLLPGQTPNLSVPANSNADVGPSTAPEEPRSGFGPFRRDTGFSIASLAASLPGASVRARPAGQNEEVGQQMVEVPSRPGSSRSMRAADADGDTSEESDASEDDEDEDGDGDGEGEHDARSIRSFESMMSGRSGRSGRSRQGKRRTPSSRMSLSDRLASMPGLSRLSGSSVRDEAAIARGSPPESRRSSLLLPMSAPQPNRFDTPVSSRAPSPVTIRISPPNPRFLTSTEDDIKVSEVGELLREYKRLAEAVRAMGGFHDD